MNCKECSNFIDNGLKGINDCLANRRLKSIDKHGWTNYIWPDSNECSDFVEKKIAERSW